MSYRKVRIQKWCCKCSFMENNTLVKNENLRKEHISLWTHNWFILAMSYWSLKWENWIHNGLSCILNVYRNIRYGVYQFQDKPRARKLQITIQKSDCKISHPNDLQLAVNVSTINSLYPIDPLTANWRWCEYMKYWAFSTSICFELHYVINEQC